MPALPQGLLYKSFRLKRIKLNKKRCQPQDRLSQGDLLELYINDEFFGEGRQDLVFLKVPDRIQVVYEDQNILLVDLTPMLEPGGNQVLARWTTADVLNTPS